MEIGWVPRHLADLRCDFMRFFPQLGIDPVAVLDGPTFFDLALRVSIYDGVMAFRVREEVAAPQQRALNPRAHKQGEVRDMPVAALAASSVGSSLIERKKVSRG